MPPADLVVLGAAVRTLDPARPHATAVAVRDGLILAVGDDAEVRAHAGPRTEVVDGRGIALVPGLTDSHIHPFHGSDGTRGADLNGLRTLDEVRGALAAERARCGPGEWLLGWGLTYDAFHDAGIGADAVADVTGDVPTFLTFFDYHSALASRPALALAGVDGPRAFGAGAEVVCDAAGLPTGELREAPAMQLVSGLVPEPSDAERLAACAATLRELNALGLAGVHEMIGHPRMLDDIAELEARGDLTVRTDRPAADGAGRNRRGARDAARAARPARPALALRRGQVLHRRRHRHGHRLAVGSRDRTGRAPSRSGPTRTATPRSSPAAPAAASSAPRTRSATARSPRRSTPTATPERAAPARTASSTWRRCATRSCGGSPKRASPRRCSRSTRWGSTSPVPTRGATTCSPRRSRTASAGPTSAAAAPSSRSAPTGRWSAPTRVPGSPGRSCGARPATRSATPFLPDQALTAVEALEGYTTEAARVIGEEHLGGRIAPGLRADLTGLGADPVDCPPDELPDVPVRLTVVDGEVVHRSDPFEDALRCRWLHSGRCSASR